MNYRILPQPNKVFINKYKDLSFVILTLLWQRGIRTKECIYKFLNPDYYSHLNNPFDFIDMKKVVLRIIKAAQNKERVLVYGDYDVDGVCSSVLLVEMLQKLYGINKKDLNNLIYVYLPHREKEGYGLNMQALEYIKKLGINLVITCDCGTTNIDELKELKKCNIDTIVVDHHISPDKRPPVFGFINPKYKRDNYPFKFLSACGVVFKVIQAMRDYTSKIYKRPPIGEAFEKWSLDLVALSTVADMMPLLGENRVLVKWGLVVLNKTKRLGLKALIKESNLKNKIGTYEIGFVLAPRINVAGRLDHANIAFDLLMQKTKTKAIEDAKKLNRTNNARQKLTDRIVRSAIDQVTPQLKDNDKILVAYNLKKKEWPVGVLGLVAGRLVNEFYRPAFVIGLSDHGLSGSGRSILGFDIVDAIKQAKNLFSKFGGHPSAAGFTFNSFKNYKLYIKKFKDVLEKYAKEKLKEEDLTQKIDVNMELSFKDITYMLAKDIFKLEPFGEQNPKPVFLSKGVVVRSFRFVGNRNAHVKMALEQDNKILNAISFRSKEHIKNLKHGDIIDIIYNLSLNEWNGSSSVELVVKEVCMTK